MFELWFDPFDLCDKEFWWPWPWLLTLVYLLPEVLLLSVETVDAKYLLRFDEHRVLFRKALFWFDDAQGRRLCAWRWCWGGDESLLYKDARCWGALTRQFFLFDCSCGQITEERKIVSAEIGCWFTGFCLSVSLGSWFLSRVGWWRFRMGVLSGCWRWICWSDLVDCFLDVFVGVRDWSIFRGPAVGFDLRSWSAVGCLSELVVAPCSIEDVRLVSSCSSWHDDIAESDVWALIWHCSSFCARLMSSWRRCSLKCSRSYRWRFCLSSSSSCLRRDARASAMVIASSSRAMAAASWS